MLQLPIPSHPLRKTFPPLSQYPPLHLILYSLLHFQPPSLLLFILLPISLQFYLTQHHSLFPASSPYNYFHLEQSFGYSFTQLSAQFGQTHVTATSASSLCIILTNKLISAQLHSAFNTCTGTVSLSPADCTVDGKDLLACPFSIMQ